MDELRGLNKLWKSWSIYQPSVWLLAIPYLIHIAGLPFVVRVAFVVVCAAYVGREFARHFIYVTTGFPQPDAGRIRDQWDINTLYSAFLVIPVGLAVAAPHSAGLCFVILVVATAAVLLVTGADPFLGIGNMFAASDNHCRFRPTTHRGGCCRT